MPDPTVKVTFFFQDDEQSLGWSENWFLTAADFNAAQTAANNIAQTRVQILASPLVLKYVRCSGNLAPTVPHAPRQRLANLTAPLLQGSYRPSTDFPDVAWTAAKMRWTNNDGTIFRVQLIRGISDEFWANGEDKIAQTQMKLWAKQMTATLVANQALIHHVVRGNPAGTYVAMAKGFYEGLTRRATGRPSYLPRGRRSK